MITNVGAAHIKRFLAGTEKTLAVSIAIGTGSSIIESPTDISLEFEYASYPVVLSTYDPIEDIIIFKCEIPQEVVATIYEIGIYSADTNRFSGNFQSAMLLDFSDDDGSVWTNGSYFAQSRTGLNSLKLTTSGASVTLSANSNYVKDFSGYSTLDTMKLAYFINDANTDEISIEFWTSPADYFAYSFVPSSTSDYYVESFTKGAFAQTGTPDWGNIQNIQVNVTSNGGGSTTVHFDGLRIEDTDAPGFDKVLVDRKLLTTPIIKTSTIPLEIEFPLLVSVA